MRIIGEWKTTEAIGDDAGKLDRLDRLYIGDTMAAEIGPSSRRRAERYVGRFYAAFVSGRDDFSGRWPRRRFTERGDFKSRQKAREWVEICLRGAINATGFLELAIDDGKSGTAREVA